MINVITMRDVSRTGNIYNRRGSSLVIYSKTCSHRRYTIYHIYLYHKHADLRPMAFVDSYCEERKRGARGRID